MTFIHSTYSKLGHQTKPKTNKRQNLTSGRDRTRKLILIDGTAECHVMCWDEEGKELIREYDKLTGNLRNSIDESFLKSFLLRFSWPSLQSSDPRQVRDRIQESGEGNWGNVLLQLE